MCSVFLPGRPHQETSVLRGEECPRLHHRHPHADSTRCVWRDGHQGDSQGQCLTQITYKMPLLYN